MVIDNKHVRLIKVIYINCISIDKPKWPLWTVNKSRCTVILFLCILMNAFERIKTCKIYVSSKMGQ